MNKVLVILDGESQLRKVKRQTSLSLSLSGHRSESRTQKTAKRINFLKKIQSFIQKMITIPSKNDN
jgi:hypothetical protein